MSVIKGSPRTGLRSSDLRARDEAARLVRREERATKQIADLRRGDGTRLAISAEHTPRGARIVLRTVSGVDGLTRGSMYVYRRELAALEEAIAAVREMEVSSCVR